jgi:y4mF family transcriptional regulator
MLIIEIGKIIKKRRKELKMTQPYLAELAGISHNTLYKLERGQTNATLDVVGKVANVLGLEIIVQVKKEINT